MAVPERLCVYHGGCADGFAAAWVLWDLFSELGCEFHYGVYGQPPPDVTGRDVILVDFSYKRPVLEEMAKTAKSILILDHHKTALEDLAGLPFPTVPEVNGARAPREKIEALFDMERSGCILAWDFYHAGESPPVLLQHIQDRDLWQHRMEGSNEIHACLTSFGFLFDVWDILIRSTPIEELRLAGEGILRKIQADIHSLLQSGGVQWFATHHSGLFPLLNAPPQWASEAGEIMAEAYPQAALSGTYWDRGDTRVFSLRSKRGFDCQALAREFGGGGHPAAAGFEIKISELGQHQSYVKIEKPK